jgi:hypothetical protein
MFSPDAHLVWLFIGRCTSFLIQKTTIKDDTIVGVIRTAANTSAVCDKIGKKCQTFKIGASKSTACCCTSQLCNGTSMIQQSTLLLFILIVTVVLMGVQLN